MAPMRPVDINNLVHDIVRPIAGAVPTPTAKPSVGDRRFEDVTQKAVLDELARVCDERDHENGVLGNLRGEATRALAAVIEQRQKVEGLESRAATLRRAYEVLRGRAAVETVEDPPWNEPDERHDHGVVPDALRGTNLDPEVAVLPRDRPGWVGSQGGTGSDRHHD